MKKGFQTIMLLAVLAPFPASGAMLVLDQRLFVVESTFLDRIMGKIPDTVTVVSRVVNDQKVPVAVRAYAEKVTLNGNGDPIRSGSFLDVTPATQTLFPSVQSEFKIVFPASPGCLALFAVMPVTAQESGVRLLAGQGFLLGALWTSAYQPIDPEFRQVEGGLLVKNRSEFLMRFTLEKERGSREEFFLEAGKTRMFTASPGTYLLDWLNGEKRLGLRLR
jgi:hypothetical protein